MTSSVSGSWASAVIATSKPLRGTSLPTATSRCAARRQATGPFGLNCARSTPQGTIEIRDRGTPRRESSKTSSEQVAITRPACRPMIRSSRIRSAGLVSLSP